MPHIAVVMLAVLSLTVPQAASQGIPDAVTVRLFDSRTVSSAFLVPVENNLTLYAQADQDPLTVVPPGDSVTVVSGALGLRVTVGSLDINQKELYAQTEAGGAVDVGVVSGGQTTTRRYPGSITVTRTTDGALRVTNRVPLESYVASVVGKEYGLDDVEGTRAMAVVARTFAVRSIADNAEHTGDGISAQVYHGLDGISEAARAAAEATRGLVLIYEDRPIMSVYSASNGGHSAQNSDVWLGETLPYLRARRDRFDRAASPYNDWLSRLSRDQVHDALSDFVGTSVAGFSIESRSGDGRVKTVRVEVDGADDLDLSGSEFRRVLSSRFGVRTLRSTLFDVSREGDHYVFEGSGYGHGVGLSQWGAHEMAGRGYNYEEILRFYYDGAKIQSITDLGFELSDEVAAAEPSARNARTDVDRSDSVPSGARRAATGYAGWTAGGTGASRPTDKPRVGW
jgi:stage II sporulation protein D